MDRRIVTIEGADALAFLQGVVTNDVLPLAKGPGIVWTALLSPQGKYLADFFVVQPAEGTLLLDLPEPLAEATLRRLSMYRLRADVRFSDSALQVGRGIGAMPAGALPDPRHPALGWRNYAPDAADQPDVDWTALRVEHLIPESGSELIPDDSYILEAGFERLHGVDFRKGCYVGQEVTARMKHKTELRKGLARVTVNGDAPAGTQILRDGREVGVLFTRTAGQAIAYLRFDRIGPGMAAGGSAIDVVPDPAA